MIWVRADRVLVSIPGFSYCVSIRYGNAGNRPRKENCLASRGSEDIWICSCHTRLHPRTVPTSPTTAATAPPSNIQIALLVGDPVKKREKSELNELVALTP